MFSALVDLAAIVQGINIPLSSTVTNLGVKIDPQLTFESHINHLCKTSFYHLRNNSKLRPILSRSDSEKNECMPLSPPDWTTVTHYSSGSLARAGRDSNAYKTLQLGS